MDSTPKQKLIRQDLAVETTMKAPETPTKPDQLLPTSRGSTARKASQAAASRLRDNMEDANKFGQQMRNKHKLPPLPSEAVPNKRLKSGIAGPQDIEKMQVVITGCPELTEALHNQCEALGITFISDARQATHVISPRMARTKKFIVAIPHTPLFVNWQWLLDTVKLKKLQPENKYPLEPALEAPWSQNLDFALILKRARKLQSTGGLFKNIVLLISDAVTKVGGFETYREIVEANGGTCGLVGRRGADTSNARVIMIADGKSDPAIKKYEKSFAKNGKKGKENKMAADGDGCEVYDREWLMLCAIRQEIIEDEKLKYL
ncbi:MAG: hypothetical protein EON54_06620 [Alcaligenaceae bacterium]|nr:MAG: hypothetical protein EON54_06620 [Alcaligenaceae bacterium]